MKLKPFVELYRVSGRPSFLGGGFSATVSYQKVREPLVNLYKINQSSVHSCSVDGKIILSANELPDSGEIAELEVSVPARDGSRFYDSLTDMLEKSPKVSQGCIPSVPSG